MHKNPKKQLVGSKGPNVANVLTDPWIYQHLRTKYLLLAWHNSRLSNLCNFAQHFRLLNPICALIRTSTKQPGCHSRHFPFHTPCLMCEPQTSVTTIKPAVGDQCICDCSGLSLSCWKLPIRNGSSALGVSEVKIVLLLKGPPIFTRWQTERIQMLWVFFEADL